MQASAKAGASERTQWDRMRDMFEVIYMYDTRETTVIVKQIRRLSS